MRKVAIALALCLALVLPFAAFAGGNQAASGKTVAVLIPGPVGYFNAVREGIDSAAKEFGINVIYSDANWNAATQMSQLEDFIQRKVDLLAVCCVDAKAIESAIPKAQAAKIPLIAFTNGIGTAPTGEFPGILTYVGQNEVDTGYIVGQHAKKLLGPNGGRVVMIEGVPGTTPQINRRAGFLNAIWEQPNIEVIFTGSSEWDKEKAIKITEDLIQSRRQFDLVFAQDAGSGAGAAMALDEAKRRGNTYVLAIDGSREAMASVKSGLIDCTTWMSAKEEGYKTIEAAHKYFNGEKLPPVTQLKQVLITKDNCDSYQGEF
jgi:ribose transport system substrate-binding protein